ncbi:MAG: 4-hydroxy-tetrahydrodipicolinate synthase [Bacteroidota bacterium]|nr:4-hydroxy-tetrahydrodipicolinate synthase [Bacteroidota bacterium]
MNTFYGTGIALVTPFNRETYVDFEGLNSVITHVSNGGADYLVLLGTTAETATLNGIEKRQIISFVKHHNPKKLPLMLGIGGNDTNEILEKMNETDFKGIDGLLSVCPYYNKPSQEGIINHFKKIADYCPVPVYLYNIPGRTGVNMTAATTVALAKHPNIKGIKEASGDIVQAIEIMKNKPKDDFLLISGDDIYTLPFMSFGGVGVISAVANALPSIFKKMTDAGLKGDFKTATEATFAFSSYNRLMFEEGNPVGVKALLSEMGICEDIVRLPLMRASDGLKGKIKEVYQRDKNEGRV